MGSAYTPGLTVSGDTVVRKVRRLPIKGELLVKSGERVGPDQVVARALIPGPQQAIKLAEELGVDANEVKTFFKFAIGDEVEKGQIVAETKGIIFGIGRAEVHSKFSGTVEAISEVTGHVLVREPSVPVEIPSYIEGTVVSEMPGEGVVIEARCAMVQGIFGVGGERSGTIRVAVSSPDDVLDANHIKDDDKGKILIGGAGVTYEAIDRASKVGVVGLVVGAVRDVDLTKFLGYDIGVAITGSEDINLTLMATEGFGQLRMAQRTFDLLKSLEGKRASMNGATQIRAGVIRPEVIVPIAADAAAGAGAGEAMALTIGTPIRVIREPYFGLLGSVTGLPSQTQTVDSGARVRVLTAKLDDGRDVTVPRANVEILAG
ncbi:MAG TPA: hypothetical protein VNI20_12075 [Fimbriimonadaceae bacterium]|nr:hypothetical protein [Fimbriimonadaceae bacterium]